MWEDEGVKVGGVGGCSGGGVEILYIFLAKHGLLAAFKSGGGDTPSGFVLTVLNGGVGGVPLEREWL